MELLGGRGSRRHEMKYWRLISRSWTLWRRLQKATKMWLIFCYAPTTAVSLLCFTLFSILTSYLLFLSMFSYTSCHDPPTVDPHIPLYLPLYSPCTMHNFMFYSFSWVTPTSPTLSLYILVFLIFCTPTLVPHSLH